MRKVLLIAMRDCSATVRTKGFIFSLVLLPVLLGGGILAVKLLEGHVDTTDRRIAIVDRSEVVAPALLEAAEKRNESEIYEEDTGKKVGPAYLLEVVTPDEEEAQRQRLQLSGRVREGGLSAFVEIGREVVHPREEAAEARITYRCENPVFDDARRWIAQVVNDHIRSLRLAEAQLEPEAVARLTRWMPVEGLSLVSAGEVGGAREGEGTSEWQAIGIPYALMMLMFMLVMAAATPLIHSVLEEKMQRIAEVLLGSVRPTELMMGKLLGAVGVSLATVSIYIVGGILAARYLNLSQSIPYHVLPWFAAYGIGALFMFGAIFIAVGSACNDLKDAQSVMMPLWLLLVVPMLVWLPVIKEPTGGLATWASLFPPFTPMLMLIRLASPVTIPAWQPWVGLAGVALVTVLSVWAAGRIFRVGILLQGKPPRLHEILRWAVRG